MVSARQPCGLCGRDVRAADGTYSPRLSAWICLRCELVDSDFEEPTDPNLDPEWLRLSREGEGR